MSAKKKQVLLPSVAEMWATYARGILPRTAGPTQIIETRRAFYAGCFAMQTAYVVGVGDDSVSEDEGEAYMISLHAELTRFFEDVKRGRA